MKRRALLAALAFAPAVARAQLFNPGAPTLAERDGLIGPDAAAAPDADVVSWAAAVVTNGGTVSAGRQAVVQNFITAEKAAGTWALTDDYFPLWGENAQQALTSLKQRRLATAVGAPTFTADRGYDFNGTSQHISTGFIGSTMGINMTATQGRIAVYERTNINSNGFSMAAETTGTVTSLALTTRQLSPTRTNAKAYSGTSLVGITSIGDSRGWTSIYLKSGPETGWYRNGALLEIIANTPTAATAPSLALFIGARNLNGTAGAWRATSFGMAAAGGPLTAGQEAAQYANVQAWATAIGANV